VTKLNEEVRAIWDQNADFWDQRMGEGNVFHKLLIEPTQIEFLEITGGELILDAACGNGSSPGARAADAAGGLLDAEARAYRLREVVRTQIEIRDAEGARRTAAMALEGAAGVRLPALRALCLGEAAEGGRPVCLFGASSLFQFGNDEAGDGTPRHRRRTGRGVFRQGVALFPAGHHQGSCDAGPASAAVLFSPSTGDIVFNLFFGRLCFGRTSGAVIWCGGRSSEGI